MTVDLLLNPDQIAKRDPEADLTCGLCGETLWWFIFELCPDCNIYVCEGCSYRYNNSEQLCPKCGKMYP